LHWYWYSVSVAEQVKSIGIGSIGKLWYQSHPKKHLQQHCDALMFATSDKVDSQHVNI